MYMFLCLDVLCASEITTNLYCNSYICIGKVAWYAEFICGMILKALYVYLCSCLCLFFSVAFLLTVCFLVLNIYIVSRTLDNNALSKIHVKNIDYFISVRFFTLIRYNKINLYKMHNFTYLTLFIRGIYFPKKLRLGGGIIKIWHTYDCCLW